MAIAERTDLAASLLAVPEAAAAPRGPVLRRGERALDLVAVGAADAVVAGAHVDVLVTYDGRAGAPGPTRLALADVEVLAARAPPTADAPDSAGRTAAPAGHAAGHRAPGGGAHGRRGGGPAGAPAASSEGLKRRSRGHRSPV